MATRGAGARGATCSSATSSPSSTTASSIVGIDVSGNCCASATRSRKKPVFAKWTPSSFGSWSTTITRPMPDLKPVSTGSEMKEATNPRRRSDASPSRTPTSTDSVAAAAMSAAASPPGAARPSSAAVRMAIVVVVLTLERSRRSQQGIDDHRHDGGVQPDLQRQLRDRRVRHRLRHDHRGRRQAGGEVRPKPRARVRTEPAKARNQGRGTHA